MDRASVIRVRCVSRTQLKIKAKMALAVMMEDEDDELRSVGKRRRPLRKCDRAG